MNSTILLLLIIGFQQMYFRNKLNKKDATIELKSNIIALSNMASYQSKKTIINIDQYEDMDCISNC